MMRAIIYPNKKRGYVLIIFIG